MAFGCLVGDCVDLIVGFVIWLTVRGLGCLQICYVCLICCFDLLTLLLVSLLGLLMGYFSCVWETVLLALLVKVCCDGFVACYFCGFVLNFAFVCSWGLFSFAFLCLFVGLLCIVVCFELRFGCFVISLLGIICLLRVLFVCWVGWAVWLIAFCVYFVLIDLEFCLLTFVLGFGYYVGIGFDLMVDWMCDCCLDCALILVVFLVLLFWFVCIVCLVLCLLTLLVCFVWW